MSSVSVVNRIAYLTSDVIVNLRSPTQLVFAHEYPTLALNNALHRQPKVIPLPTGADPGATLLQHPEADLITLTAELSSQLVARLTPHTSEIAELPVVLSFMVTDDLSELLLLRSAVPFFLVSVTAQQAHDNALLSARLSRASRKAVIHAFYAERIDEPIDEISEDQVLPFLLDDEDRRPLSNGGTNGHLTESRTNGYTNGHSNTPGKGNEQPAEAPVSSPETSSGEASPQHAIADDIVLSERFELYQMSSLATCQLTHRSVSPFTSHASLNAHVVVYILGKVGFPLEVEGVTFVQLSLVNPLLPSTILLTIPPEVSSVIVLEHAWKLSMRWPPLFLEIAGYLQYLEREHRPTIASGILGDTTKVTQVGILKLLQHTATETPFVLGTPRPVPSTITVPSIPKHESSYLKALNHLFADRLEISNSPSLVPSLGELATTPEFALGRIRAQLQQRDELVQLVQGLLQDNTLSAELHSLASKWVLSQNDRAKSQTLGSRLVDGLESLAPKPLEIQRILSLKSHLPLASRWIIGSDSWSYDIGASGLHHAIASGLNINILIIDTVPYSARNTADPHRRKQDVGLYAMNHGDVYVASVAVYSSYSHVLQALLEADRFNGPSVVLAYLPYQSESTPALDILTETKLAIDSGYWPLYRWDPSKEAEGQEPFSLDSESIRNELQAFLDRQNHLSQLVRSQPQMAAELVSSLSERSKEARRIQAKKLYDSVLSALDAPPLLVLYASDGGAAEKKAKRLAKRASARGLSTTVNTMDSTTPDVLAQEENVVFITSTAGQGEPPQNGRKFFKSLNIAIANGELTLNKLRYSVFAMGDSHYWPRPEDAQYFNRPGKDLDARLEKIGGQRLSDIGLGDEQDVDGTETAYKVWESCLWKALGVDSIEVEEAEPEPITYEHFKAASSFLRGTIAEGLEDTSTGALLAASDTQISKFHGVYQQDDRDIREGLQAQGLEPAYYFMIRLRMPAGVCQPHQWLKLDRLADEHGSGTMKLTTRQTFQFHGIIKRHLKPAIQDINRALLDTLSAAGDIVRNVTCSSIPSLSRLHEKVFDFAKDITSHFTPRTTAYHEIWLDKKLVAGDAVKDVEPLYTEFYLPRKFKIAVAVPPTNDVDVFTNDLGFIAIVTPEGELAGFNVITGGGMGMTHGNKNTYPRLADSLGFCTYEQGIKVTEAIVLVQRDNGNRADRKRGRVGFTIDKMGLDVFKAEVEKRLGYSLAPARPYTFTRNIDDFGWTIGENGKRHFTMFIENGRIQDIPERKFKTGLREIAKIHKGTFRLTANQHVVISDINSDNVSAIQAVLREYKMDNLNHSGLRLASSACVALPTCGLAMAESERYLPLLIDKLEKICEEHGLRNDSIVMRMSGCPNGCTRPYVGEIGFIGKAPGVYSMLLGGGYHGQRLNKVYRESVTEPDILKILRPMIKRYAIERLDGERFGDWTIRAGYIAPTLSGKDWYSDIGGEGKYRE